MRPLKRGWIWNEGAETPASVFQIKTTVMDVESPLIKSELEAIDVKLSRAETTLFWNSEGTKAMFVSPGFSLGRWGMGGSSLSSVHPGTQSRGCFCLRARWSSLPPQQGYVYGQRMAPLLALAQRDHLLSLTKESGKNPVGTSKGGEVSTVGLWGLGRHGGFPPGAAGGPRAGVREAERSVPVRRKSAPLPSSPRTHLWGGPSSKPLLAPAAGLAPSFRPFLAVSCLQCVTEKV